MPGGKSKRLGMSVRGFARKIGVTENAVRTRIKRGKRIAEAVLEDGSLDPDRAETLWFVDLDVEHSPRKGESKKGKGSALREQAGEALDIARLKAEREAVDLATAKIKLETLRENSVDREVARKAASSYARMQRDAVLNFAARKGPELAGELGVDIRVMVGALDAAMRELLVDLSEQKVPFQE